MQGRALLSAAKCQVGVGCALTAPSADVWGRIAPSTDGESGSGAEGNRLLLLVCEGAAASHPDLSWGRQAAGEVPALQQSNLRGLSFPQRDSWEQTLLPDAFSQPDPVPTEALQTLPPSASCLSPLESVSSTQHRSASWGASLSGTQPYSLHTLEDLHHAPGYPTPPPYPFAPFMTMSNDLLPKGLSLSPDEGTDASSLHDPSPWTKDDGSMAWGSYECRRAY